MRDNDYVDVLIDAITESEIFIKKAKLAMRRIKENKYILISGSKETAAVKRSSMDLTRSLVKVRRR